LLNVTADQTIKNAEIWYKLAVNHFFQAEAQFWLAESMKKMESILLLLTNLKI